MYNPKWFREERKEVIFDAIDRLPFGTLVTVTAAGVSASHVPMLVDRDGGKGGTILGHIARGNLQWRDTVPGTDGLAIFMGPHGYISPTWYKSSIAGGEVVPTWNYVAVHARGPVAFFTDEGRLLDLVTRLTERFEGGSESPWKVSDAPADYLARELKAIVGFEVSISSLEGKWKLGQNRPQGDREGMVAGLKARGGGDDLDLASEISRAEGTQPPT
ncbi:MAG: FMN-binding negative transcriptional regulator [Nitrososphaerota archaeon]|nr:FMN-binding negative transcriptional regulator [Nitrososphaerota archaeon]MDG6957369.1 FMN-binding negative transcriptional regulator [Nitrososphaerota archaeon]MDG6959504.1 FMN-binding negative transcriptional regulator [Nitrososphaerota archaeon]MDG6969363.1 FMN-binding negative transcriptional regulator [Nitrososphaerota archaeon]MDG6972968.1 FMN-binding negative transcriptional regulator [Nitrososphaerota archaeon]